MKFVSLLATLMLVHTLADAAASLDGENNTGGDASASASNAIIKTWEGLESRITLLPPAGAKKEVAITLTVGSPFSMAGYNGSAITIPKGYHVSIAAAPPGGDGSAIPRSITSGGGTRVVLDAGSKGTLFIAEGALLVDSVTLKNGIALTGNGGVLTVNPNGTAAFAGCSFVNNTAPAGDGGVAHVHSYGSATFTSCSFVKNSASAGGGAVDVYLGSARFVNCSFQEDSVGTELKYNGIYVGGNVTFGCPTGTTGADVLLKENANTSQLPPAKQVVSCHRVASAP